MADTKTVYARTTGSDGHGDGTLYEPYARSSERFATCPM